MSDHKEFQQEMVQDTKDNKWTAAAMRFTEELTLWGPQEMMQTMGSLNKELRGADLPPLRIITDSSGQLRAVNGDSKEHPKPIYDRPRATGQPLADEELERLAQHLEAVKKLELYPPESGLDIGRAEIKRAADFILEESLKLDEKDQNAVLKRASDLSFRTGHSLNVVFADLDGDGKRDELSDVAINFVRGQSVERIDLYDPPKK